MTGPGAGPERSGGGGGDGRREDGPRGHDFRGPTGLQHGNGNLQVNFHEHRAGIISACAVALVCVATVIAVQVGSDPTPRSAGPGAGIPASNAAPPGTTSSGTAPSGTAPSGTAGADPSVLTGRLVNDGSGLCLRAPGPGDGLVPVQDACTGDADRAWTLAPQNGALRTLRNADGGRCLSAAGPENFAAVRQVDCTARPDGQHWELLWGAGARSGHFMLRSTGNAKCLMVQGDEAGRPAAQTSCGEAYDDQWWHLSP
ncbi:RICIN domain-containing protein [Kitasatospora sp. NPDC085464]|uniref:RICIN domain-containing protein n=1 Tax=Kitasatospora sp. NPDC085464 TaxID=3364063 RepID=UPI0037CC2441